MKYYRAEAFRDDAESREDRLTQGLLRHLQPPGHRRGRENRQGPRGPRPPRHTGIHMPQRRRRHQENLQRGTDPSPAPQDPGRRFHPGHVGRGPRRRRLQTQDGPRGARPRQRPPTRLRREHRTPHRALGPEALERPRRRRPRLHHLQCLRPRRPRPPPRPYIRRRARRAPGEEAHSILGI